jgi:tetratricopeptide (TPR) repeat protein
MPVSPSRTKPLVELLKTLFTADELRRLAAFLPHGDLTAVLPSGSASLEAFAVELVQALERRGQIDHEFFARLEEERPGRRDEITRLRTQLLDSRRFQCDVPELVTSAEQLPQPAPLPRGSRMHIASNPLFVGRNSELRALADALHGSTTGKVGQIAAVTGLGGIGKSQLAATFVHRYGQFFEGGVFWMSFADPASVPAEVALCGGPEYLDLWPRETGPDLTTQVARVRAAWNLSVPRLLVFDNCEDEALLDEWRPKTGGCRVLVTCRRPMFSRHLGVHTLPLNVLPRAESLSLLWSLLGSQAVVSTDEMTLDAICDELGDLPLALHLAGSFLARYRSVIKPAKYLTQLRDQALLGHPSLLGRGAESSPTGHELHGGRTFALSWDRLDPANGVDAMARALLRRASCLAPGEPIPRALLMATLGLAEDDPDVLLAYEDALRRLLDLGLLDALEPGTYMLHRLVRAFVQQTDGGEDTVRTDVEQGLLREIKRVNSSGSPTQLLSWQPHLRAVTDAAMGREDASAASMCRALGHHLHVLGDYAGARPYSERALVIREKQLGPDHLHTATSLNNLALLLHAQGAHSEAKPLYERALAIWERQLGPNHPDTASSLNNLAALLHAQKAYADAKPLYERALAIREQRLGPDHPHTATSLNNLAALLEAQGAHAEARSLYERALAIYEKRLGPDHPYTATGMNNLALLLEALGAHTEARALYERALTIREKQLGPHHPLTAKSLNNLASLLRILGAHAEANQLYERAFAILAPEESFEGSFDLDCADTSLDDVDTFPVFQEQDR